MTSYSKNFDRNINVLTYLGLWDIKTNSVLKNRLYCVYQLFSLFFLASFIILEYVDLYVVRHDIEKLTFNLCASVATTATLLKTIWALQSLPDINKFKQDFDRDSEKDNDKDHKEIILKASLEMKSLNNFFSGLTFVLVSIWSLIPFLDYESGARKLLYRQWFPLDIDDTYNYMLAYAYQLISLIIIACNIVTSDLIVWCFMISLIAEYEILECDIRRLNELYGNHCKIYFKDEITLKIIKDAVVHHQEIISRIREFENVFHKTNMCQIAAITLLFAIIGFDVIVGSAQLNTKFWVQCIYLFAASVDLYWFCSYGTRLEQKSYDVCDAIFNTPWYLMKNRYRSHLSFIIAKAQRPPIVTGGKLMHVNLIALLSVLKTTYNMLAVFRQVASKNRK